MGESIVWAGIVVMFGLLCLSWSIDRIADAYKERTKMMREENREQRRRAHP